MNYLESNDTSNTKILFVEKNKALRKLIERELFATETELYSVSSPEEAFSLIGDHKFDIAISDTDFDRMNGYIFLSRLSKELPECERVLLRNYQNGNRVDKAITQGLASTSLEKPWRKKALLDLIRHIVSMKEKLNKDVLKEKINKIEKLPTLPEVYNNLMKAIGSGQSFKYIAEIVQRDVAISTKVLQVANSAYYGFKATSSLVRAIIVIGLTTLRDIVLTYSITNQMDWTEKQKELLEDIALHSLLVSRLIADYYTQNYGIDLPQEYSSVGITHDIGKIIILQYFEEHYEKIIDAMNNNPELDFYKAELESDFEGQTHAEIGAYFLKNWNLPDVNCEVALGHHTEECKLEEYVKLMEAVRFANEFANHIWQRREYSTIKYELFDNYGLNYDQLKALAEKVRSQINEH
ncbi:MAG: HDOD domain-containing protein [Candidatus Zixiibacteriota bacterium]